MEDGIPSIYLKRTIGGYVSQELILEVKGHALDECRLQFDEIYKSVIDDIEKFKANTDKI